MASSCRSNAAPFAKISITGTSLISMTAFEQRSVTRAYSHYTVKVSVAPCKAFDGALTVTVKVYFVTLVPAILKSHGSHTISIASWIIFADDSCKQLPPRE